MEEKSGLWVDRPLGESHREAAPEMGRWCNQGVARSSNVRQE
jgi:hypothetical protein